MGTEGGKIALDCSVRPTDQEGQFIISTTDFFFPLVDNPYLQGRIGAANVLSDLYAEGVDRCDFVLMLLASCRDMEPPVRKVCTREMVRGFRDACTEAGTAVTGGQTVLNPWPIIGGVATSVVRTEQFVPSNGAQAGDVIVLTKPIGTQVAVNVHQWRKSNDTKWQDIISSSSSKSQINITEEDAEQMMHDAVCSMSRLNRNAAKCMLKYKAHAATDVTGFGILGHAQNLAENQKQPVGIILHTLPCLKNTPAVNEHIFNFQLTEGYSAETSGGLFVALPKEMAQSFCDELLELDGTPSWIIGNVISDPDRKATLDPQLQILEV
uniref:Selenide, water dikinase n=1 Tax=Eucampia antarctica TaxID=49252 RepID=A0A7S2S3L6_9STRA|mmetsp:Transcript_30519/g.29417  ORF Transcript_30519/g.29417 Transcript_30519/m.29417 type:complete len:324 (+) Transcript_30519:227-1198(+)